MYFLQPTVKSGLPTLLPQNKLLGFLTDEEVSAYFGACDLFCMSSVYATEAFGIVQIEAMSAGKPVVATKIPGSGVSWVNAHKESGINVDPKDSEALAKASADTLHTTPYRSYPSGVTATASKRHEYVRWASSRERYIIEDDFESEFSVSKKTEETLFCHSSKDNVIYMNTFSKTVSPSLRIAYMVLPKELSKTFNEQLGFYSCTVPTYIQLVLARLITNGDFERHINRVRRLKRKQMSR